MNAPLNGLKRMATGEIVAHLRKKERERKIGKEKEGFLGLTLLTPGRRQPDAALQGWDVAYSLVIERFELDLEWRWI